MSKLYIRITNDDSPVPVFYQRIDGKGKPLFTAQESFAKRFENIQLAEEIAEKLRSMTSERDGESSLIEIIDTATGKPVGEAEEDEPEVVCPEPVPPFGNGDNWETRFEFVQTSTGVKSTFEMCKTPEGLKCRYTTMQGAISPERPKEELEKAVIAWTDCMRAWLIHKIKYGGGNDARK